MASFLTSFKNLILVASASLALSACATNTAQDASFDAEVEVSDPFESVNRGIFAFNEGLDKVAIEPVTRTYRTVVPEGPRQGLRNFLRNLRSPIVIGNELLQGDFEGVANATGRMIVNTLAGFGGIVDWASHGGLEYEPEDFGQTLAVWGFDTGPYAVLPILGPGTLRDNIGFTIDSLADPVRLYVFNHEKESLHYVRVGVSALDQREELLDIIDDLRRNSFDYYAAVRSTYLQRREALVNDEDPSAIAGPEIPDYDDI